MKLRRVGFQRSEDSPARFSDDYREWLEVETQRARRTDPAVEAMQLEVIRRMRLMQGESSTAGLKDELDSKLSAGEIRLKTHMQTILDFLTVLESLDGPERWVCTSHYDLIFWDRDYQVYADTPDRGMLYVSVLPFAPPDKPILRVKGERIIETPNVLEAAEEAAHMLLVTT
ncbi:MAG: hypothetical protein IPM23_20250 [Candidatus Melainabacteria bacterium]|nr:hypothetical protein [Candidatus Melainabacteria bacterium]